jgi:hypothetical protein
MNAGGGIVASAYCLSASCNMEQLLTHVYIYVCLPPLGQLATQINNQSHSYRVLFNVATVKYYIFFFNVTDLLAESC